jgi:hypothetical protein
VPTALFYLLFILPRVKTRGYHIGRTYGSFLLAVCLGGISNSYCNIAGMIPIVAG